MPVFNLQYYIQWIFSLMFRLEICDVQFPDEIQNVGFFFSYFSSLFNESTIIDKFPLSASIYSNPSTFHLELLIPRQPFGILSTFDMLIKTRADIYYNVKFKPLYIIINPNPAYLKTVHIFVDTCIIFITMLKFWKRTKPNLLYAMQSMQWR